MPRAGPRQALSAGRLSLQGRSGVCPFLALPSPPLQGARSLAGAVVRAREVWGRMRAVCVGGVCAGWRCAAV